VLAFKSEATASIILSGLEMIHMMRKRQARYAYNPSPSIAEQLQSSRHKTPTRALSCPASIFATEPMMLPARNLYRADSRVKIPRRVFDSADFHMANAMWNSRLAATLEFSNVL